MSERTDLMQRIEHPLFYTSRNLPSTGLRARHLDVSLCAPSHAVSLNKLWHSRLPHAQDNPWKFAFKASYGDTTYAVALWHNPSARTLPSNWLELRRMAIAPDAPYNTASFFLARMVRHFRSSCPEAEKCISYQDVAVHQGTIYKASNWYIDFVSKARIRQRSGYSRPGSGKEYRTAANGEAPDRSEKIRWAIDL